MSFAGSGAKKLRSKPARSRTTSPRPRCQQLVHELQKHQIELNLQNEELRRAQEETDAAEAKYADLFDCAPIAYFIFDQRGLVLDANLTGARLLGLERGSLRRTCSFPMSPRHSGPSSLLTCKRFLPPRPDNPAPCS